MGFGSFFTRALDVVTPWDRGGELIRRRKREEEEQQRRNFQPSQAPGLSVGVARPNQQIAQPPKPKQPVNIFKDLNQGLVFGQPANNVQIKVPAAPKQTPEQELKALTDKYRQQALEEEKSRTSWFDRQFTDRKWDKRAEATAINRATREYQERHGWNRDPKVLKFQKGASQKLDEAQKNNTSGWIAPVISTARVGTGIAEGAGGLYDILTPGKGTNRFTKAATRKAEEQDQLARDMGIEKLYRTVNVPLEIASYFTPGVVSKGGKISQILGKTSTKLDDILKLGSKAPRFRRLTQEALQEFLDPKNIEKEFELTGRYMGQDSAKGKEITPQIIAENVAQSAGGAYLSPLFRGLSRFVRRGRRGGETLIDEGIDAATSAGGTGLSQVDNVRRISVGQDIPIDEVVGEGVNIPVRTPPTRPGGPIIRELGGDAPNVTRVPKPNEVAAQRAADRFNAQVPGRPDTRVGGITPRSPEAPFKLDESAVTSAQDKLVSDYADMLRDLGEGNGVAILPDGRRASNNFRPGMGSGKITKAQWLDEARRQLEAGEAEGGIQKAFNEASDPEVQALLNRGEQPPVDEGRPIDVKEVKSIPVTDQTVVPTDLPETPGRVRLTEATAPANAEAQAVAAQMPAPILPKEVQEVLDNPKQFNKRQVAAARNQAKLAKQYAKTQESVAESMSRIEATKSPDTPQPEGYAPTGEFARGRRGNAYQKASAATEAAAGEQEMALRSVDDLLTEVGGKDSFTAGDRRRITAALENIAKSNPNDRDTRLILKKLQSKSRTELGQGLAMIPKVVRKASSSDTLTGRWESKIAKVLDNPSKLTDEDWNRVQTANDKFTLARDNAAALEEQFKRTGSEADFKAWEDAHKAARQADVDAKFTEAAVAQRVLRGEKGAGVTKVLDEIKQEADVNTMDTITASMLSGTGTGFRNTFGTELAGIENRLGANLRAKVTKLAFGENVGGFNRKGARMGRKLGVVKLGQDARRRAEVGGKNPIEWAKNWSTTINSGGESSLQSQVNSRLAKYYRNEFAEQGLKGKELDMRMRHALLTDPDEMGNIFLDSAMKSSGLTGIFQKSQAIEKAVTDYIGRNTDSKTAQTAAKLAMRIMVGFPTATTNFLVQSGKRLALGVPSFMEMGAKLAKGDKKAAALAFDRGLKEAGSGAAMVGLGMALGSQGMVSGPYPDDPEERERWKREGISENSIKIGNAWYPIPQGAGMLGLPIMFGAAIGREGDSDAAVAEMFNPKNLSGLLPTDQIQGFLNMASGDGAPQDLKNTIASATRAVTPAGSFWNQLAKSFDETKNDTTTKDFWSNTFDAILAGNPITNTMANIPDATDDAGNVLKNPNPAELAFGATSASQGAGIERSGQIQANVTSGLKELDDMGILGDPNLQEILDDDARAIYNQLTAGKQIDEKDLEKLQDAFVKGVSSEGTDTAYLEREQYDTNLAVLRLKKKRMEADKTVRPSSLKDIDTAIKRGEIYKEHEIPYDMISDYKSVGVEEWRKMGDPEEDEYDPDMYEKLWQIDQLMTKGGVSYKRGALDKNKYFVREGGSGRGGRGGGRRSIDTDFGQLDVGPYAPRVQQYQGIDVQSGQIPHIRVQRPNIVHKITSSGQNIDMAAIDNIREVAQDTYLSINGAENDDTGDDLEIFENNFIRSFNLWLDELDTETYWNQLRTNGYELATISNQTTFSWTLPDEYRTPVFSPDKYLKFVNDGIVIAKFKLVDPNQVVVDDEVFHPDRATFVGRSIVLSRVPTEAEVGSKIVLDVVGYFPKLTRKDDTALTVIYSKNLAVLGVAKNNTLADVTKVSLSPSFAQKYLNELNKALLANAASNETDEMRGDNYSNIGGIW